MWVGGLHFSGVEEGGGVTFDFFADFFVGGEDDFAEVGNDLGEWVSEFGHVGVDFFGFGGFGGWGGIDVWFGHGFLASVMAGCVWTKISHFGLGCERRGDAMNRAPTEAREDGEVPPQRVSKRR